MKGLFFLACLSGWLLSQDLSEDALFGDDRSLEMMETFDKADTSTIDFGGSLFNRFFVSIKRQVVFADASYRSNTIDTLLQGDFFLDLRLSKGFKAYLSSTIQVYPSSSLDVSFVEEAKSDLALSSKYFLLRFNEFFFDANIKYKHSFRLGKQVLTWGRGFFWNPSDLVNEDRLDFTDLDAIRSGVYGMRYSFSLKSFFHFSSFLKMDDIDVPKAYTLTLRTEFLVGPVELGLMGWFNWVRDPIIGFDASYGLRGWNLYFESTLSFEGSRKSIEGYDFTNRQPIIGSRADEIHGKALLGFFKSFVRGRLSLGSEIYYNSEGYKRRALKDPTLREALKAVPFLELNQGYLAFFLTYRELWNKTTTIGLNAAVNLVDGSSFLLPHIKYTPVADFFILLQPTFSIAANNESEMSFRNQFIDLQVDLGVNF